MISGVSPFPLRKQARRLKITTSLSLHGNKLTCDAVVALAPSLDLNVCVRLKDLYLQNNRIGDRGAAALTTCWLPHLTVCMLQEQLRARDPSRLCAAHSDGPSHQHT